MRTSLIYYSSLLYIYPFIDEFLPRHGFGVPFQIGWSYFCKFLGHLMGETTSSQSPFMTGSTSQKIGQYFMTIFLVGCDKYIFSRVGICYIYIYILHSFTNLEHTHNIIYDIIIRSLQLWVYYTLYYIPSSSH